MKTITLAEPLEVEVAGHRYIYPPGSHRVPDAVAAAAGDQVELLDVTTAASAEQELLEQPPGDE